MKCGYGNCKFGGEVLKEEGIKVGSRWYHKECVREKELKQEIESYWFENINKGTVIQVLRKAINDLVKIYDAEYIYWVVKECKVRKINLSYPMGMKKLCDDNKFKDEWNRMKAINAANKISNEFENYINTEQSEINYINRSKNFLKIL